MPEKRLFQNKHIRDFFLTGKSLPRWVILLADMFIIFWSFSLSFLVVRGFHIGNIQLNWFLIYLSAFCLIAFAVLFLMKMHTGLLRFSNTQDMMRVFAAVFTFNLLFLGVVHLLINPVLDLRFRGLYLVLLVNFFICTSLLIMFRILGRSFFHTLLKRLGNKSVKRVLIYGSDKNAVLVKQALESNGETHYVVKGFVDTVRSRLNSYMEQKKIYHIKDLPKLATEKNIDELVLVNENLDERDKRVVIERSLRLGIHVLTVPPAANWLSGKLDKNQIRKLRIEDLLQRKPISIDQSAVRKDLHGKRVLVTGAAGSIGGEIVRQVIAYDPELIVLCDQGESPLHEMQLEIEETFPDAHVEIVISDIRNYKRMHKIFDLCRPQVVFHAAAYKHVPLMEHNPYEAIAVNVGGTKHVADLSVQFEVEKFVMISTDKAVNPTNVMGASKRLAEIYTQALGASEHSRTRFITTRFGNVLGSNGSVIPRFRAQIEKGGPITVTHPEITRFFMTISEAVQLVLEAGTMGHGGEIYVFDMGKPVRIIDMAKKMIQLAGLVEGKDIEIVFTGLRPGEKLYEELLASAETTLPTHHEKIKIAKVRVYPYAEIVQEIETLLQINQAHKNDAIVQKMKAIIPEFKSKNSPYELLDYPEKPETV